MVRDLLELAGFTVEQVLGDTRARGIAIARDPKGRRVLATAIPPHEGAQRVIASAEAPLLEVVDTLMLTGRSSDSWFVLTEALETGWSSLDPRWTAPAPYLVPRWAVALAELVAERESRAIVFREVHPALVFVSSQAPWVHGFSQRALPLTLLRDPGTIDDSGAVLRGLHGPLDRGPTLTADPFWLGAIVWHWRHGRAPFSVDFDGLDRLKRGEPSPTPSTDVDRFLAECFHPRGSERPALSTIVENLRDDAWSVAKYRPPSVTIGERIDAIARFLRERAAAGELASGQASLEVTTTTDRAGEEIASTGVVSITRPGGNGDAFRFSGDPDAVSSSFERRVKTSRSAPNRLTSESLAEARAAIHADAPTVSGVASSTPARKAALAKLDERVAAKLDARLSTEDALRRALRGTSVTSTLQAVATAFTDLETTTERYASTIVVTIHLRVESLGPPRMVGEEHSDSDDETVLLVDRRYTWVPGDVEIDALIDEALARMPRPI